MCVSSFVVVNVIVVFGALPDNQGCVQHASLFFINSVLFSFHEFFQCCSLCLLVLPLFFIGAFSGLSLSSLFASVFNDLFQCFIVSPCSFIICSLFFSMLFIIFIVVWLPFHFSLFFNVFSFCLIVLSLLANYLLFSNDFQLFFRSAFILFHCLSMFFIILIVFSTVCHYFHWSCQYFSKNTFKSSFNVFIILTLIFQCFSLLFMNSFNVLITAHCFSRGFHIILFWMFFMISHCFPLFSIFKTCYPLCFNRFQYLLLCLIILLCFPMYFWWLLAFCSMFFIAFFFSMCFMVFIFSILFH